MRNYLAVLVFICLSASAKTLEERSRSEHWTFSFKHYEKKHALGLKRRRFLYGVQPLSFLKKADTIPKSYSMRGKAGPVEDQGSCGSCWDFSLTSVLRGTFIMAGKDSGRLSFNYLLNCAREQAGCNGGDFDAAQWFVTPKGAPAYGSDGPYIAQDGSCKQEPPIASAISYKMLSGSFKDLAYTLGVLHQPISIDVAVEGAWESYSSGVYSACSGGAGDINHMVALEGYDCETSIDSSGNCVFDSQGNLPHGVGTLLIRNSWGTSWGDGGYITTKATDSRGNKCNAIATDALIYQIVPPVPPPPPPPPVAKDFSMDSQTVTLQVHIDGSNPMTQDQAQKTLKPFLDNLDKQ